MISYSKEEHLSFINEEMYKLCVVSGLPYETVTRENYDEILQSLRLLVINPAEFHRIHYALRYLYFNKLVIEQLEDN
jgi:hypothetical protein